MRVRADASEVHALVRDFEDAPAKFARGARGVVKKGALNIKNELQREAKASGIAEAKDLARWISYDVDQLSAEVGPVMGNAGSFAFLYLGNSKNGPVLPDPVNALNREAGNVEKYLGDVAEDIL